MPDIRGRLLFVSILTYVACSIVCLYLQDMSISAPKIFAPGVISTGHEFGVTFTPDGNEVYFSRFDGNNPIHIFHAVLANGEWQQPEPVSFSSDQWSDLDPFLSPDGKQLFFVSTRPAPGTAKNIKNMDIWVATRKSDGWSEPFWISRVNSAGKEGSPSVDRLGNLYFFSDRVNGANRNMIYEARLIRGEYAEPVPLPAPVNSGVSDTSPFISPDGNALLFYSTRPGGFGKADLYVAFKRHRKWDKVKNLGPQVNGPDSEYNPAVAPDGECLFFGRGGNIYKVDIGTVSPLKSSLFR